MTRRGKIARLSDEIREELNSRLDDGGDGKVILDWLNALPEVRAVLDEQFGGIAVSKQNLSEWRLGGHAEWRTRRDLLENADELLECAEEVDELSVDLLADRLATVLTARYAALMAGWNGEPNPKFESKARVLGGLCQDIVRLQRTAHQAATNRYALERLEEEKNRRELDQAAGEALAPMRAERRESLLAQLLAISKEFQDGAAAGTGARPDAPECHTADAHPEGQT